MSSQNLHFAEKDPRPPHPYDQMAKIDEEEHNLIVHIDYDQPTSQEREAKLEDKAEDVIDPIQELTKNNNIVPLLAVLPMIDLNLQVEGKPLLSKLCTLSIPLALHLKGREIIFQNDADNRTALHQAIAADDTQAANWCFQHGIGNIKDNFGNTPIIEAIKHGRKSSFLLCLHYRFYDSQAPHICAVYNRTWQLQVLHRMGYDVTSTRDSEHFTPLERAVANYSYDAAAYLAQITDKVSISYLATKTDSKGIIRTIQKVKEDNGFVKLILKPVILPFLFLALLYFGLQLKGLECYQPHQQQLQMALAALLVLYGFMYLVGWCSSLKNTFSANNINLLALLGAPEFPHLIDVCPQCLCLQAENKDHCRKCGKCVNKLHFHNIICVNQSNEIFWFLIETYWLFVLYQYERIFTDSLRYGDLLLLNFSNSTFFGNAAIIEKLLDTDFNLFLWFVFLKIFLVYQAFCCFEWLCMLVLSRTHKEINNTQNYPRLYRVVKTSEGGYKNQEIKLLEKGFIPGLFMGIRNILQYFFK